MIKTKQFEEIIYSGMEVFYNNKDHMTVLILDTFQFYCEFCYFFHNGKNYQKSVQFFLVLMFTNVEFEKGAQFFQ